MAKIIEDLLERNNFLDVKDVKGVREILYDAVTEL